MNITICKQLPLKGFLSLFCIGLVACSHADQPSRITKLDTADHHQKVTQEQIDRKQLHGLKGHDDHSKKARTAQSLSLDQSIQRAFAHNLDVRLAALETLIAQDNVTLSQLQAFPSLKATGTFTTRSNDAASSSESILTGTQSLEPSSSSEPSRRLYDLEAQWNIIDAAIAYMDGVAQKDQTLIAKERLRKVKHNIERDVIAAYWRSHAYQAYKPSLEQLQKGESHFINAIETASDEKLLPIPQTVQKQDQLSTRTQKIDRLSQEIKLSVVELKSLIDLPLEHPLTLTTNIGDPTDRLNKHHNLEYDNLKTLPLEQLERVALTNRPELREAFLNENISIRDTRKEILRSFPGLNLIYTKSYDSNKFLRETNWLNFSAALSQSITDFLTLPQRYKQAKNQEDLAAIRRNSLSAAIMAQVHIARIRLDAAEKSYDEAQRRAKSLKQRAKFTNAKASLDSASAFEKWLHDADLVSAAIERNIAYADLQRSQADFMSTLGVSIYRDDVLRAADAQEKWDELERQSTKTNNKGGAP